MVYQLQSTSVKPETNLQYYLKDCSLQRQRLCWISQPQTRNTGLPCRQRHLHHTKTVRLYSCTKTSGDVLYREDVNLKYPYSTNRISKGEVLDVAKTCTCTSCTTAEQKIAEVLVLLHPSQKLARAHIQNWQLIRPFQAFRAWYYTPRSLVVTQNTDKNSQRQQSYRNLRCCYSWCSYWIELSNQQ